MSLIRITEIKEGKQGIINWCGQPRISADLAVKAGLMKPHALIVSGLKVGDTCTVPYKKIEEIKENANGAFSFEIEHPQYANRHLYSDEAPYEIVEWVTERKIKVRKMSVLGEDEYGNCREYVRNLHSPIIVLNEHRDGAYYDADCKYCPFYLSDNPHYYRDPNF